MKWATGVSRQANTTEALGEAVGALAMADAAQVDVVMAFFSGQHVGQASSLADTLGRKFPSAVCVGCNVAGVVGAAAATDDQPALALTVGILPQVEVKPIRFEPDVHDQPGFDWPGEWQLAPDACPHVLVLSQAATFETESLLAALDRGFAESTTFGGLVGGGQSAGDRLMVADQIFNNGAVGLVFSGEVRIDTLVAQACRPVGEPLIVTDHTQNVIHRVDRGNPMEVFRGVVGRLSPKARQLADHAMFVGLGVHGRDNQYRPGDFVVRDIIGFNPNNGDLAVAAPIDDFAVIQFHLMEPHTAALEFEQAIEAYVDQGGGTDQLGGALLLSGIAAASGRTDKARHESELLGEHFGELPVGGFFADGQIAPVGSTSCLHGYATTVTLFWRPEVDPPT